jgi:hypothetical protein
MTIKLLVIDPDIAFIVPVKRALETLGDYAVSGFASGRAGLDQVRREPYDVAIIDVRVEDMALPMLIGALRGEQDSLPILLSGTNEPRGLTVQGTLPKPYLARQVDPIIRDLLKSGSEGASPTDPGVRGSYFVAPTHPMIVEPPRLPDDTFSRLVNAIQTDDTAKQRTIQSLNKVLKNLSTASLDEPPIPENATIRDMVTGDKPPIAATQPTPIPVSESQPAPSPIPPALPEMPPTVSVREGIAMATLSVAGNDEVQLDQLSLQAFVETVKKRGPDLVPLIANALQTLDEPSFITQVFETTQPIRSAEAAVTEVPPVPDESPVAPPSVPEMPVPEIAVPTAISNPAVPVIDEVATLAVQLTQLTVNSTAQATLLTQGEKLIAAAGPLGGMPGLAAQIDTAWKRSESTGDTLIQYLFWPEAGDILLFSILTLENMRLSMIFPASTPVKEIRKQAEELAAALQEVPSESVQAIVEPPAEADAERTLVSRPTDLRPPEGLREAIASQPPESVPIAPAPRAEGPYAGYGFVWLPRAETLPEPVSDGLIDWLNGIAAVHAWTVEGAEVQPRYISVQISIPANETPAQTVETLMHDSAARAGTADLWADGYYVVAPGRPITLNEIAQFVEYQRSTS